MGVLLVCSIAWACMVLFAGAGAAVMSVILAKHPSPTPGRPHSPLDSPTLVGACACELFRQHCGSSPFGDADSIIRLSSITVLESIWGISYRLLRTVMAIFWDVGPAGLLFVGDTKPKGGNQEPMRV